MDDLDDLIERLRVVYANLANLKLMEGPELLLPGRVENYRTMLEAAYAAYGQVETVVDELGQALEYEHARLDEGMRKYGTRESERE